MRRLVFSQFYSYFAILQFNCDSGHFPERNIELRS